MDPTAERAAAAHPTVETLADHHAGLLDAAVDDGVSGHLAGCAACRATLARLHDVDVALGGLPPAPMPADVADRLRRALAESPTPTRADHSHEPSPVGPAATVLAPRGRGGWGGRLPAIAAAAAVVAAVGALGYALVGSPGSGGESGGAASGNGPAAASAGRTVVVNQTGRHYTVGSLRAAVPGLLAGRTAGASRLTGVGATSPAGTAMTQAAPVRPQLDALRGSAGLTACVRHLGADPGRLLAVDFGSYAGHPAAILLFPDAGNPARVDAYVVGADCATNPNPLPQLVVANR